MIKRTPSISRAELSKQLNISERQVRKLTGQLRDKGILTREGGNSGKWIINRIRNNCLSLGKDSDKNENVDR